MTHILAGLFGAIVGAFVGYAVAVYGDLAVTPARELPAFGELPRGGRSHRQLAGVGAPANLPSFGQQYLDITDREWLEANAPFMGAN